MKYAIIINYYVCALVYRLALTTGPVSTGAGFYAALSDQCRRKTRSQLHEHRYGFISVVDLLKIAIYCNGVVILVRTRLPIYLVVPMYLRLLLTVARFIM